MGNAAEGQDKARGLPRAGGSAFSVSIIVKGRESWYNVIRLRVEIET
jgi:hypothetical protein